MQGFARELEVAEALARAAGACILDSARRGLSVERKSGDEPVTEADRAAQRLIVAGLRQHFPDDGILAEESIDQDSWRRFDRVWLVDPLDGTRDLIAGRDGFSVMIGLLRSARPVLGIVHQPRTQLTYRAAEGHEAVLLRPSSQQRLRPSSVDTFEQLRVVRGPPDSDDLPPAAARPMDDGLVVGSVGLKICIIARGDRDLYVNPDSHCRLWDTCAPEAILAASGGRVSDVWGRALDYRASASLRLRRGIVASNGRIHDRVIERLVQLYGAAPNHESR